MASGRVPKTKSVLNSGTLEFGQTLACLFLYIGVPDCFPWASMVTMATKSWT